MPDSNRITRQIEQWVDESIDEHGQGEEIFWEAGVMGKPDGSAAVALFFWMPGAVLGSIVNGSAMLPAPSLIEEDGLKSMVAEMLRQLREGRSQQLTQQVPTNGHRPSGLILPGG